MPRPRHEDARGSGRCRLRSTPSRIKRDAEFARLRALLRPAGEEPPPPVPAPLVVPPSPPAPRPVTPGDFLRALEREIQDAVPTLAALGPERCGAQIAAWTGQVRELRNRLAPQDLAVMRPAFRIFLEHLTELRAAMEASFVDALEHKWSPPDWSVYIEVNRARAQGRPPQLSAEQIEAHHRSMLRALVQQHRRNVPGQAISVVNAAAQFLPADDGQLRSAMRRHQAEWRAKADAETPVPPTPAEEEPPFVPEAAAEPTGEIREPAPDDGGVQAPKEDSPPDAGSVSENANDESEFNRPWTK